MNYKLLLLLMLSVQLFGQLKEFEIKEREAPASPAVFVNYPNDAALIIYSSIRDLNFESNVDAIVSQRYESDKYTIIIKTERQYIKVKKAGYIENRISVPKLNARDVRYYTIEEKAAAKDELLVSIEVEPADAVIYSDGKLLGTSGTHSLAVGVHKLRIEKSGYKTIGTDIEVNSRNIVFRYAMEVPKPVILEVRSVPDKAKIYIDNIEEGETDEQLFKMPGSYDIKISKPGYLDYTARYEVKENDENIIEATLEKTSVTLRIEVTPGNASLQLNKKSFQPNTDLEIATGSYLVEIEREGYDKATDNIMVERGKPLTKKYSLARQKGSLQLKVKPINASIELTAQGEPPIRFTGSILRDDIPAGSYTLKVEASGYETITKNIVIRKNSLTEENITLSAAVTKTETGTAVKNESSGSFICGSSTVSYEGKTYNTVKIGDQCWLKENLNVGTRINGKSNPSNNGRIEKYCYNNVENHCDLYGGLYTWDEAMGYSQFARARGICPDGWHIPTDVEFQMLGNSVENNSNSLKAVDQGRGIGAGNNASGFWALLAGRRYLDGIYDNQTNEAYFWSSTEYSLADSRHLRINFSDSSIDYFDSNKGGGFSIRCLKD